MSVVVSDASPVHYLILTGTIDILPRLFSKIIIPEQVSRELQRSQTPPIVRSWISALPAYAEVRVPTHTHDLRLHPGEEQAIALALELNTPILLDEKEAREAAKQKGLLVIGTVGLLERAAIKGFIDLNDALEALLKTNMCINRSIIDEALRRRTR